MRRISRFEVFYWNYLAGARALAPIYWALHRLKWRVWPNESRAWAEKHKARVSADMAMFAREISKW